MSDPASDPRTPDERPRPQYGEYATPEEQRARIRHPDASRAIETGQAPHAAPAAPPIAPTASAPAPAPADPAVVARRGLIDRIATIALLVYGLANVVTSLPQMISFTPYADALEQVLGVDASAIDLSSGRTWGTVAAVVLALGWVATALLSWRRLRRGRLAFWVPLAGGAVTILVSGLLLSVGLMSDPAVVEQITSTLR